MMTLTKEKIQQIAKNLNFNPQAFIDGKFCKASDGATFETINPATGDVIAAVSHCNNKDVDRAVESARKAFNSGIWSRCSPEYRKEVLLKLAELVRQHTDELAVLESIDSGKTINDCLMEIGVEASHHFQWYGELIDKIFGKVAPTPEDKLALVVQEPVGVVGAVVPWNFPFLMATWKIAPALAAGCSVIIKPAEDTSLSIIRFAELAQQAGIPDGVLHILPGMGETTGQAIGRHPDIDIVSFTGSTEIGGKFLSYAGESNLKSIGLELGGKSPFIVLEDADINEDLIENAVTSAFWNGGQNCSANMRQIVSKSVEEKFTYLVNQRIKSYVVGDPLDPKTDIGPMINKQHKDSVNHYIDIGKKEGAKILSGGLTQKDGCFVLPTLFSGLKPNMVIAKEEIFGPVLGVMPVNSMEEALMVASDSDYGLHATVFTRDIDKALYMAKKLPCGTISINEFSEGNIATPFGGYKKSGSLARDNGIEAMQQYLQSKTIWININKSK